MRLLFVVLVLTSMSAAQGRHKPSSNTSAIQQQSQTVVNEVSPRSTSTASNAGNSQETNFKSPRQTPMAYAPDAYPTAPCRIGYGAGGSGAPFGFSIGGSKVDKDCQAMELARLLSVVLHNKFAAAKVLCSTKAAKRAGLQVRDCLMFDEEPAVKSNVDSAPEMMGMDSSRQVVEGDPPRTYIMPFTVHQGKPELQTDPALTGVHSCPKKLPKQITDEPKAKKNTKKEKGVCRDGRN